MNPFVLKFLNRKEIYLASFSLFILFPNDPSKINFIQHEKQFSHFRFVFCDFFAFSFLLIATTVVYHLWPFLLMITPILDYQRARRNRLARDRALEALLDSDIRQNQQNQQIPLARQPTRTNVSANSRFNFKPSNAMHSPSAIRVSSYSWPNFAQFTCWDNFLKSILIFFLKQDTLLLREKAFYCIASWLLSIRKNHCSYASFHIPLSVSRSDSPSQRPPSKKYLQIYILSTLSKFLANRDFMGIQFCQNKFWQISKKLDKFLKICTEFWVQTAKSSTLPTFSPIEEKGDGRIEVARIEEGRYRYGHCKGRRVEEEGEGRVK